MLRRIPIVLAVMICVIAGFAKDGHGKAKALTNSIRCHVHVEADCRGVSGKQHENINMWPGCPQEEDVYVNCNTSEAYAYGHAWKEGKGKKKYAVTSAWANTCCDGSSTAWSGKSSLICDSTRSAGVDTTTATLDSVPTGATIQLIGNMHAMTKTLSRLIVEVFQKDDTMDVIFSGKVVLNGTTKEWTITGFDSTNFVPSLEGDTIRLTYDFIHEDIIGYAGTFDSVGVSLEADPQAGQFLVPSLSQYGILALLTLILTSGVWFYIRKRHAVNVQRG